MSTLDDKQTYTLRYVPNTVITADIEVVGGPAPVRFVAPVGTAVPVVSLVDHLTAWLSLPAGEWTLSANDRALVSYAILDDVSAGDGLLRLRLKRAKS